VIPKVGEKEEGGQSNTVSVDVGKLSQDVVLNRNQSVSFSLTRLAFAKQAITLCQSVPQTSI